MRIKLDLHSGILEYDRKPMQESRFRLLYTLLAAAMYVGLAIGVTALCGFLGLVVIAAVTVVVFAIKEI